MDLFEYAKAKTMENESPLASRLRPTRLEEVVGQQHIVGKDKLLYRAIKADKLTSVIFYEDYDDMTPDQRLLMQEGMTAFGGIAPTYRIALLDKPTIIWDFHSLMLGIQMMFSFMLTDSENPIKLCRHCTKAFVASRPSAVFCSPQCKNKHNVYKSRARNKSEE